MTTPLDSLPLAKALLAQVTTAAGSTFDVYLAGAPHDRDPTKPYTVCYPDTGIKSGFHRTLANDAPDELRHQWTCVGVGPEQAVWVADKVSTALLSTVVTLTGRRVWKTVEEDVQQVRRDDQSTGLYFTTAQYLTRSDPD